MKSTKIAAIIFAFLLSSCFVCDAGQAKEKRKSEAISILSTNFIDEMQPLLESVKDWKLKCGKNPSMDEECYRTKCLLAKNYVNVMTRKFKC